MEQHDERIHCLDERRKNTRDDLRSCTNTFVTSPLLSNRDGGKLECD